MGQLTNQFVSQSYQGILNLANANTGFTANLQTITDGLGGSSPLQMSQTQVNISGTFTVNGAPVSVDTGSLVTTSSFNAYTSSVDLRFDGIELETGSLQNQINGLATTSSLTSLSSSIAVTDLNQNNVIAGLATTGSLSGYTTLTTFNNYTSSNDSKVNSLISQTGSYVTETESGSFVTNVYNDPFMAPATVTVVKGNGTSSSFTINYVNNATSASFAQTALSASYAPDISNRNGLITTGSAGGNQSITGSLNVEGTISATSASFTYVNTIYETASVIYSSGSNQLGDAADDTQTLWGAVKLPSGSLSITGSLRSTGEIRTDGGVVVGTTLLVNNIENPAGSGDIIINPSAFFKVAIDGDTEVTGTLKVTGGITGSLQGTASYATQALSASYAPTVLPNGVVSGSQQIVDLGFATTGSNNFVGNQNITGSVNISGSLGVNGNTSLNVISPNVVKQNLVLLGTANSVTSSTILNGYLNAITTSLSNNDVNFAMTPGGGLVGAPGISNQTGSIFISGSNNFLMTLGSVLPASQGRRNVLGNANILQTAGATINTSSLTIPVVNNNYFGAPITLTLTTGSVGGNNAHQFSSNILLGGMTFNHPSASISTSNSTTVNNNINVGTINSITNGPTILTSSVTFQNNIVSNTTLTLNHQSSSIQTTNNIIGGAVTTFNNRYYNTGSNNALAVSANLLSGQGLNINAAGSPSTNVTRPLVGNLIGGQAINISLEQTGTDLAGLRNSIVYGNNINVTGSHSTADTTRQGAAFFGRFNGEDNGLADSARTVFAVGTGTATSNRRTGFYITSGSLVGVSGSMDIKGGTNALVVTGSQTIENTAGGVPALIVRAQSDSQTAIIATGSLQVTGSSTHRIAGGGLTIIGNTTISGSSPLQVGTSNNEGVIKTLGGSNWLYRSTDTYNTVVGNTAGLNGGFFSGSEKNMVFNGFFSPFATGSNNVLIQGGGDGFVSGSNNIFIGNHDGHAGGSNNLLLGATSYSSGSIFDNKFEVSLQGNRILHKQSSDALQIGDDTQVTGSLQVSNGVNVTGSLVASGSQHTIVGNTTMTGSLNISGSGAWDLQVTGGLKLVTPDNGRKLEMIGSTINLSSVASPGNFAGNNYYAGTGSYAYFALGVLDEPNYNTDVELSIQVNTGSGIQFQDWDNGTAFDYVNWMTIAPNLGNNPAPQFKRSVGITGSLVVSGSNASHRLVGSSTTVSSSLFITGSNVNIKGISNETGSYFIMQDSTGSLHYATPLQALPALMAVGAFYSTGSYTATANQSGSFIFDTSLNVNSVQLINSGSKVLVDRSGTYNVQFSTQISQGSGEGNIAIWLKKNGTNVADTATYITVASNHKDVLALNLWDTATSGSYYELVYQSDSNNTTFETVAATGNIPRSPSIILTVNQVR